MFSHLLLNGLLAGPTYAFINLGFGLIYRVTKFFHFAHGAVYAAGREMDIGRWDKRVQA
ncbi:MAG: hypothetical protein HY318_13550 [Armatimonadetes bacterium]|nr:hypothetical protein [Armatimonadota bacterium]